MHTHTGGPHIAARPLILVVEEDDAVRSLVETVLAEDGYAVLPASDGLRATLLAAQRRVDLVVLNLCLGLPAVALADALRRAQPRDVPILALSTLNRGSTARDVGAYAVLDMPFDIDQLAALVARGLAQSPAGFLPPVIEEALLLEPSPLARCRD